MANKHPSVDSQNPFREAVKKTRDVEDGFCPGLRALGSNSDYVDVSDSRQLTGSVDLDAQTRNAYPRDSRWDYAVGYGVAAYFLEVHPAETSEVSTVLRKAEWLERWLRDHAPALQRLSATRSRYWVPSGRNDILLTSKYQKMLAMRHVVIVRRRLVLPVGDGAAVTQGCDGRKKEAEKDEFAKKVLPLRHRSDKRPL